MTPFEAKLAQSEELTDAHAASLALLCQTFHTTLYDDDAEDEEDAGYDTDEYEAPTYNVHMATSEVTAPYLTVHTHMDYVVHAWHGSTHSSNDYAISDSGTDATILGHAAKVISQSGRIARISGYDPATTKSADVPIVSAYIKVQPSGAAKPPIILLIHEAPYIADSPITLLSEYQLREYGLVVDSVATKH